MSYSTRFSSRTGINNRRSRPARFTKKTSSFDPSVFVKKAEAPQLAMAYTPKHAFKDFEINPQLKSNIVNRGYTQPTPIQDQAIPVLLQGKDVVGIANTGTGKTAAFLIPLIDKIINRPNTKVLIITPTRELAVQIEDEFRLFVKNLPIYGALCIGGLSINNQIRNLERRPQVVIGTPGRLKDLYEHRHLNFNDYSSIVLDEVDRMLDMGFIRDIKYIVSLLPQNRHSLFFSATLPHEVQSVMNGFLKNPVVISVTTSLTAKNIDQDIVKIGTRSKVDVLHDLLIKPEFSKVLVFGRTKWGMEKLARELNYRGFKVTSIHGNKSQNQRQSALNSFKQNRVQVLLATDIASRGLDIDDVTHVINYDLPETYEDYIHRIGRTGRAQKTGSALTFID